VIIVAPKLTPQQVEEFVAKLKSGPIGKPELELLASPHNTTERWRSYFINTARRLCPELDSSLLREDDEDSTTNRKRKRCTIDGQLAKWSRRWHLDVPWVMVRARRVLERHHELMREAGVANLVQGTALGADALASRAAKAVWTHAGHEKSVAIKNPAGRDEIHAAYIAPPSREEIATAINEAWGLQAEINHTPFNPAAPKAWHPDLISAARYRAYMDDYIENIRGQAKALGYVVKPPPQKQKREHFAWLVRYQVAGESYATIARDYSTKSADEAAAWHAVQKAIKTLAKDIGLPLRRSREM